MRKILAITQLTMRTAVRSKVVASLLIVLFFVMLGLPLVLHGDGTLRGEVQIILQYTLGAAGYILALSTLWAGCGAISLEIQSKQIQLLAVKPVHRFQLWFGKWLGLMILNVALLALCGGTVYGLLQWKIRPDVLSEEERVELKDKILVSRWKILPEPEPVESEAEEILRERMKQEPLPEGVSVDTALESITREVTMKTFSVPPGYKKSWIFKWPRGVAVPEQFTLRYRFSSSQTEDKSVQGLWLAGNLSDEPKFESKVTSQPGTVYEVSIPGSVMGDASSLEVEYANINTMPVTIVFPFAEDVALFIPKGTFHGNYVRALLIMLARLAFLAALGVTVGALLSMPVATFVALQCILFILSADYIRSLSQQQSFFAGEDGAGVAVTEMALKNFYGFLDLLVHPLYGEDALAKVVSGEWVSWFSVLRVASVHVLLYGGMLAIMAAYLFDRREVALPSS